MDEILKDARGKDAYFLNFSDGEPYSGSYEGRVAHEHTRKQVQKMITNGIKVISYFIGHAGANSSNNFRTMYGKDASFIDVSSVTEVSKTMNKKFLELA
jgi:nitric oxide reductase activation protein